MVSSTISRTPTTIKYLENGFALHVSNLTFFTSQCFLWPAAKLPWNPPDHKRSVCHICIPNQYFFIKGNTLCNNNSHNIHLVPKLVPFLVALGMSLSYALVNCTIQPLLLGVSRAFAVILHIVGKCPALVLQPVVSAVSCQTVDISPTPILDLTILNLR